MEQLDLTAAALEAIQAPAGISSPRPDNEEARGLRERIIGVLIRARRLEAERSLVECASYLRTEPQVIEAWEFGDEAPSLPQLELLSGFLDWRGRYAIAGAPSENQGVQREYILLRRRLIGALLRQARESRGESMPEFSAKAGLEAAALERFELGEERIPLSRLAALAQALESDLKHFAHTLSAPRPSPAQTRAGAASESEDEWRAFAADSDNRAFIRLAMAFQTIARDDLHRIADALFAILRARGNDNGRGESPS